MARSQKVVPCLWFDTQAEEAASFYASLFEGSRVGPVTRYGKEGFEIHGRAEGTAMTVDFELAGSRFVGLNGGPLFTFAPAISLFVVRETEAEVDELWRALSEGGSVLMELAEYPWSEKYGWLADRYGLSWQIALGRVAEAGQAITPAFLFVGEQCGRAEEAMNLCTSLFEESGITHIQRAGPTPGPLLLRRPQYPLTLLRPPT